MHFSDAMIHVNLTKSEPDKQKMILCHKYIRYHDKTDTIVVITQGCIMQT